MTPTTDWMIPMIAFWALSLWMCAAIGHKHLRHKPLTKTDLIWLICSILASLLWGVVAIGWAFKGIPMYWMLVIYSAAMMLSLVSQFGRQLLCGALKLPDSRLNKTISVIVFGLFIVISIIYLISMIHIAVSLAR